MNGSSFIVHSCLPPPPPANYTSFYVAEPLSSVVIRLFLSTIVLLAGFVGNCVVIRAVARMPDRKPLVYVLVNNIAVGELGHVITSPSTLLYEVRHDWILGRFLCKFLNPTTMLMVTNITITLAAIAVYRYITLASPLSRKRLSPIQTKLLVASFWCVGFAVAIPSVVVREMVLNYDGKTRRCRDCWDPPSARRAYRLATEIIIFVIPLCVMIVSYALVGLKLGHHILISSRHPEQDTNFATVVRMSEMENQNRPFVTPGKSLEGELLPANPPRGRNHRSHRGASEVSQEDSRRITEQEYDLLKMIFLIVSSFLLCYIPFQVFYVLHNFHIWQQWKYGGIAADWLQLLTLCPSALHPLLYGTRSKFFAKAFSRLVRCR